MINYYKIEKLEDVLRTALQNCAFTYVCPSMKCKNYESNPIHIEFVNLMNELYIQTDKYEKKIKVTKEELEDFVEEFIKKACDLFKTVQNDLRNNKKKLKNFNFLKGYLRWLTSCFGKMEEYVFNEDKELNGIKCQIIRMLHEYSILIEMVDESLLELATDDIRDEYIFGPNVKIIFKAYEDFVADMDKDSQFTN